MSTISDKVLEKIKKDHIKPLPSWQFKLRNGGQWAGFIVLAIFVALSFGLLWYFWSDTPWLHGGRLGFGFFFGRIPLVLLAIVAIGGFLALLDFRTTGRGYRYSILKIGAVLLSLVVLVGWGVNYLGVSQRMDNSLKSAPFYQGREAYMMSVWQKPSQGLLAGEITALDSNKVFVLQDFDGKNWSVDAANAIWRHNLVPKVGLKIKIIGTVDGDKFITDDIRPWMGSGGCGAMQKGGVCGMMR